ncbi:DUF2163 domain-containing protein [Zavarzinia aquatilis]|uniref:Beta tubulin n=1 Tax=Zavarzinia aquatilis TaxID=2211142 RepID=A0A317E960_9PROT|nr:DUF2163 domain-containing protein [Zavarzinia aquatilis]PWR22756.1 beta tubulin [Zavarzinia aquatilis]
MKELPPGLADHIAGGVTTLARCWRLTRRDGVTFGFTDHDRDLVFDDIVHRADSGFTPSAMESLPGLAVSNLDVEGALRADAITEADLAEGRYDDAECLLYLVNWQDVTQRVLLRRGHIGEVRRGRGGFSAELRGLAHRLDQSCGRSFERGCAWTLGDARCGIDLTAAGRLADIAVTMVASRMSFAVSGIGGFAAGAFANGRLVWTGGANEGLSAEILRHVGDVLTLLLPPARAVTVGDTARITLGCDRKFATCRDRFVNAPNFGGFPHIPGNDFILSYPVKGGGNDGSSLF